MTPKGQEFLERIQSEVLVGDGAFGTVLYEKGISIESSYEQLNLIQPKIVEAVFQEYVNAGAVVIETNSFCANAHKQKKFGLEKQVKEMTRTASQISRKCAGSNRYVAGAIGPLTRKRRELDEYTEEEMKAMFREPMEGLIEGGADLLILETFSLLSQLELALEVALVFDVPVICQMAFGEEGTTDAGVTAERAARKLTEKGAHVVGANCRSGPSVLREILERQEFCTHLPLSVYPNAGYAQQVDGRYIYQSSPQYFGEQLGHLVQAGACLVGGCCGTTPEHVRMVAQIVGQFKPKPRSRIIEGPATEPLRPIPRKQGMKFMSIVERQEKFVTVEIEPPRGLDFKKALEGVRLVATAGCDALNVPDNALAVVRMDNVIFADLLRQHVELPVILHLTCRDKNVIALQSDLLGAQVVGIEAILAVTGDPASIGDQPGASSVYDINSIGLVEMIHTLNQGMTPTGIPIQKQTDFAIGVAINPNVTGPKGLDGAFFKLGKKISAGAQFAESQPIYDLEILKAFLKTSKTVEIPICVGVMPIISQKNAEFLHNEVPGIRIPQKTRDRFLGLNRKEGELEGLRIAKELIDEALQMGARHFYIVPPLEKYELVSELVRYIKEHS